MDKAQTKFNTKPVFAICSTEILFEPKMMALGGVATGSINAKEAEIVAGIIKNIGFIFNETASPFIISNMENRRIGKREVMASGTTSKIYQTAISKIIANVC